ncbi:MAG TPA: DUF3795 domain-containing protein [Thermotogota bacterium]|nr:DUF3795 domain-containing protein [Thermotogota bacterium]HPH12040.1 DUF3795 domain-containing protein [Thermotogota bacterium]HPM21575.1 DUF3795 domain-containing protein [Thermotogota bacterium]
MPFLSRAEPDYALCGLNCCLCPRFHTDGPSRCPGCGGPGFEDKHPSCAVMGYGIRHGRIEYCFRCPEYPCARYKAPSERDSFVSYVKVLPHFREAQEDLDQYLKELKEKFNYLKLLIDKYNDGKSKTFYCVVVNNMDYRDLCTVMEEIRFNEELNGMEGKLRAKEATRLLKQRAEERGVVCILRK